MERREINVDFTCDHCTKTRATARFVQKPGDPERVVTAPADWYEVRRGAEVPRHLCSLSCLGMWATLRESA